MTARSYPTPRPRAAFPPPLACLLLAGAACGDRERQPAPAAEPPAGVVTVPVGAPAPAAAPAAPAPPAVGWDADAGLALVVPDADGGALVVAPGAPDAAGRDTARGAAAALPGAVHLLAERGLVGEARAAAPAGGAGTACAGWPRARLGPAAGADALPRWTVGLAARPGAPAPDALPLDSLEAAVGPDSAAMAAALTRLAAGLPPAPGLSAATRATLRGVPFRVRRARGFAPDGRTRAVVAALTRTMNQEAAPAADAVLLVAERPHGAAEWRLAYSEHAAGREETLPAVRVLAALRLASGGAAPRAALVLAREDDAGVRYALLERAAPGRWAPRWTSALVACGS